MTAPDLDQAPPLPPTPAAAAPRTGADQLVAAARPRWVVILGVTASTQRRADHWQATANVAFAAALLVIFALIARGLLGKTPLMAICAITATAGVLFLVRIQLSRPFNDEEDQETRHGM